MKLSFIVPVYNAEKYLRGCIDSLYRQELSEEDFEVVCINDGSTDNSKNVLESCKSKHNNFVLINQENRGVSHARNAGIDVAKGKYIRFVDADDYIADNMTAKLLEIAFQYDLDMLYTSTTSTDKENCFESKYNDYSQEIQIMRGSTYFSSEKTLNSACFYFIKKKFLEVNSFKFIEGRYLEDGLFSLSLICKAERVAYCDVDYYRYVERPKSIMHNREEKHQLKMIDDFCYAIIYINQIINAEIDKEDNTGFISELMKRRDSYTFFMQIRMLRSSISLSKLKEYMNTLADNNLYPYPGLAQHYGKKLVFISKLLNLRTVYMVICYFTRIPCIRHLCERLMGPMFNRKA